MTNIGTTILFVATSIMNGLFEGGDTIYNFSGGVHQNPCRFSMRNLAGMRRRLDIAFRKHTESVVRSGRHSVRIEKPSSLSLVMMGLPMICQRIYGKQAGVVMSRFMVLHEPQPLDGTQFLAPTLPEKLYPLSVLWGALSRDEPSWTLKISHARTLRVLQKLNLTREKDRRFDSLKYGQPTQASQIRESGSYRRLWTAGILSKTPDRTLGICSNVWALGGVSLISWPLFTQPWQA